MGFEFFVGHFSRKITAAIFKFFCSKGKLKTQNTKPKTFSCSILLQIPIFKVLNS